LDRWFLGDLAQPLLCFPCFVIHGVHFQEPLDPALCARDIAAQFRDLAQRFQRNDILGVDLEDVLERLRRFGVFALFHQAAAEHDVTTCVVGAHLEAATNVVKRQVDVPLFAVCVS
jgi:hypothetical protein